MTDQDAIKTIKAECYVFNPLDFDRTVLINTALDLAVDALKEKKWIPVTEKLPIPAQEVLVTYTSNGRNRFIETGSVWDGEWALTNDEYMVPGATRTVLAWKPMPDPYQAESEDKT